MHRGYQLLLTLLLWPAIACGAQTDVPTENTVMPGRDAIHDFSDRAARLVAAIASNKPETVGDLFFPADAFAMLKDMMGAMDYYQKLVTWYNGDIAREHDKVKSRGALTFVSFHMGSCVWKKPGSEYNKIPYWSCRRSTITAKDGGGREVSVAIKTLINWGNEWYVTHMGPIPAGG